MSIEDLFGPPPPTIAESFDDHVLTVKLLAGAGDGVTVDVECKGAEKDSCMCDRVFCQVKELIAYVGLWDVVKAAGEIELAKLSAKIDWRDPDEPWIEVEP